MTVEVLNISWLLLPLLSLTWCFHCCQCLTAVFCHAVFVLSL